MRKARLLWRTLCFRGGPVPAFSTELHAKSASAAIACRLDRDVLPRKLAIFNTAIFKCSLETGGLYSDFRNLRCLGQRHQAVWKVSEQAFCTKAHSKALPLHHSRDLWGEKNCLAPLNTRLERILFGSRTSRKRP